MKQKTKQHNNNYNIPQSDFLLDLRQQIVDEPLVKSILERERSGNFIGQRFLNLLY